MVCCENDVAEGAKLAYRRVMIIRAMPKTQVSSVSSDVLIKGEEGLGKEARVEPLLMYESWVWLPVISDQPVVGRGGGIASIDVRSTL
jgi:hypothetical protein